MMGRRRTFRDAWYVVWLLAVTWDVLGDADVGRERRLEDVHLRRVRTSVNRLTAQRARMRARATEKGALDDLARSDENEEIGGPRVPRNSSSSDMPQCEFPMSYREDATDEG